MKGRNDLCERASHDCFGEPYENCNQCFIRDNGPWGENPWLKPVMTNSECEAIIKWVDIRGYLKRKLKGRLK